MSGKQLFRDLTSGPLWLAELIPDHVQPWIIGEWEELATKSKEHLNSLADKYNIKEELKCECGAVAQVVWRYVPRQYQVVCADCGIAGPLKPSKAEAEQAWRDLFQRGD